MDEKRITAGELSKNAYADKTSYDALEVGYAVTDDTIEEIYKCIDSHYNIFDEEEFCVVMLIATDPLIHNLKRRKFYATLFLPSPRPNQAVFYYNKRNHFDIKRLWVLPCDVLMAELASMGTVNDRYKTMQYWSRAFFRGVFWDYIRAQHGIDMLSEQEYLKAHREELIKAGCQVPNSPFIEEFDFSKIKIDNIVDTKKSVVS